MNTPLNTPVRQAKLGISSTKTLPLANEYKKLLHEQHQRLWIKHQQDLDFIDDIRSYVKARLSIERDYTSALNKLAKQHSAHIAKKFTLLNQCDPTNGTNRHDIGNNEASNRDPPLLQESDASDSRLQKRLANNGLDEPDKPCSLYKVWYEHINRLQATSKNRAEQFEQLIMVVDKLKDIRSHKASIGKKCLDTHLKRIHEDVVASIVDVEKARKLYYEDESQAKKARENEEKIKKKRSGLLTKFTDLQAKKEKTSAQREANDIQSTQARNDYIMALAAGDAHLQYYYQRDLSDFIHTIDDGVLDHCKIFMATLSECDINSLKDALTHAQYWSKMINLTGSQKTNSIFLECEQSSCLRDKSNLIFEPCNNDPIQCISLEHNADYALQHEIDKWFTWFKKECRNLSQLMHQLKLCQRAFAEGKKSIELNGQTTEDVETKIIELKQQIRKSEAAKLKAQARLKVIKEGGMQIEEWSAVEDEIRADMARVQEELEAKGANELIHEVSSDGREVAHSDQESKPDYLFDNPVDQVQLQVSKESDDSDAGESIHNLASVSRSTSNLVQKQQNAMSGYSALTDPSLVWQDDYSGAWGIAQSNYNVVVTDTLNTNVTNSKPSVDSAKQSTEQESSRYDLLAASKKNEPSTGQQNQTTSMTVQSSSPLSAIMDPVQTSSSPYQGLASEAYKSDYECDYNRSGHQMRSAASSAEPYNHQQNTAQTDPFGRPLDEIIEPDAHAKNSHTDNINEFENDAAEGTTDAYEMLNRRVVALYTFEKTNDDDLAFNENDILRIIEVNDANWVRARNEGTGEEGYIPASYVRLVENDPIEATKSSRNGPSSRNQESNQIMESIDSESAWNTQDIEKMGEKDGGEQSQLYCRALYDYKPEADTFEDDGLPHLSLVRGELMRIIDQGEDDGWWLVSKEDTNTRGHVPSMLVEELDANAEEDQFDGDEDEEDENGSERSVDHDLEESCKAMPSFEPPVLLENSSCDNKLTTDSNNNNNDQTISTTKANSKPVTSLIQTSFIIIEPTPEVESKRALDQDDHVEGVNDDATSERQVVVGPAAQPPSDVSYSVINEDFVLEGPTRKPTTTNRVQNLSTQNVLERENFTGETETQTNDLSSKTSDGNYEPLSEVDSLDMPAPPSVVIESFEDDKRDRSASVDNEDDRSSLNDSDSEQAPPAYFQREIRHTGNVDVNPMLRHRAEEFSKQIIAEAIMLAPGADVGPSTSSADII